MNATDTMRNIEAIDLEAIKRKLMHEQSGERWSAARADAIAKEYRRFLFMMHQFPQESFAPLVDVDTFWHYHILDTRKYAADCQQTFGYFLHHHPYVGIDAGDSVANAAEHAQYGQRMRQLYQASFGEPCPGAAEAWCAVTIAANDSAWCAVAAGSKGTAWCALNVSAKDTAWCAATAQAKDTGARQPGQPELLAQKARQPPRFLR
ncbi:MAG: glycine-rich domain-containing protein [Massilia sp.]